MATSKPRRTRVVRPYYMCVAGASAVRRRVVKVASLPASVLLLVAAVLLPFITFAAAFCVTDRWHPEVWTKKGYFLSAAIDLPPASHFGSLGMTLTLAAFGSVAFLRFHIVEERLRFVNDPDGALERLHRTSLIAALTAAFGGHGVGAVPHNQSQFWHNSFAATFVLCGLVHFHLESRLERLAGLSSLLARTTRLFLVSLATCGVATFLSHVVLEEMNAIDMGIGKLNAAAAEIVSCACFLIYLATYSRSFHESKITIQVPTAQPPSSNAAAPPPLRPDGSSGSSDELLRSGLWKGETSAAVRLRRCRSAGDKIGAC